MYRYSLLRNWRSGIRWVSACGGVACAGGACGGGASSLLSKVSIADLLTGQKLGRVHWQTFLPSIGGVKLYWGRIWTWSLAVVPHLSYVIRFWLELHSFVILRWLLRNWFLLDVDRLRRCKKDNMVWAKLATDVSETVHHLVGLGIGGRMRAQFIGGAAHNLF